MTEGFQTAEPAQQSWIRTEDRRPDVGEEVVGLACLGGFEDAAYVVSARYCGNGLWETYRVLWMESEEPIIAWIRVPKLRPPGSA